MFKIKKLYPIVICLVVLGAICTYSITQANKSFNSPGNNYPTDKVAQTLTLEPAEESQPGAGAPSGESSADNSVNETPPVTPGVAQLPASTTQDSVEALMSSMTLEEKIYQMIFATPESITKVGTVTAAGDHTRKSLEKYPVGGIIYFAQNIQNRSQVSNMIANSQSYTKIPLFIGVDEEGGLVSRLGKNSNMQFPKFGAMKDVGVRGNTYEAYTIGNTLGTELKKLGFNVDFAPVADVIIDPNNSEIGSRSFGTDPNLVGAMVEQFVYGMEATNVSSVLKHFPGHGSTTFNSHTGYSESKRTMADLCNTELIPFQKGIAAGSDFVMVSHMSLVNAISEKVPASLSKEIITNILKSQIGFNGIVITDAMNMGAITTEYSVEDASVRAVNAGVDMLLMPYDIDRAYSAIYNAVQNGTISEARINDAVRRILTVKMQKIGI